MSLPNKYRVLGLDNSRYSTGWSIVDVVDGKMTLVDYGYLDTKHLTHEGDTLIYVEKQFEMIIDKFNPNYIAAEAMFVGKNSLTSMVLSHIHAMMILVARKKDVPVQYYAVMTMKSTILGGIKTKKEDGTKKTGDEMKEEVKHKVIEIFGVNSFIKTFNNDVTDSISAITTFVMKNGEGITKPAKKKKKIDTKKEQVK
jgi:crossover junction endodeoxyribonuclease RuvC